MASAEIATELRRDADYVRVSVPLTVVTMDEGGALTMAQDAFQSVSRDALAAAAAQFRSRPRAADDICALAGQRHHDAAVAKLALRVGLSISTHVAAQPGWNG